MSAPTPDAIGAEIRAELDRLHEELASANDTLRTINALVLQLGMTYWADWAGAEWEKEAHRRTLLGQIRHALSDHGPDQRRASARAELADAQARLARGLALHHGVPDLSCPCETLRCEACGEVTPCSTEVALAEQGGQTP